MSSTPLPESRDVRRFRVSGMSCAGCAGSVTRALESLDGVTSAAVDHEGGEAIVRGPAAGLPADAAVIAAVDRAGFAAEPIEADRNPVDRRSDLERSQTRREQAWARRAATGVLLWIPMVILHWTVDATWAPWASAVLATAAVVLVGSGFYRSAGRALIRGRTNMDTLISLGATTAWIASLVRLIGHQYGLVEVPAPLYFGETAGLFALVSFGHWLEARASAKAGAAIRELLELQPEEASRLDDTGGEQRLPLSEIVPGDRLRIRPGERIPVDGVVVSGASDVDSSAVTGEPIPVMAGPGDHVAAGCLNGTGTLVVRATADGARSTVARIAALVAEAQSGKAEVQRLADRISAVFVPIVIAVAVATVAGWWLAGDVQTGLISAVTVLVISCPCALGIATPIAVTVAAGTAGRHGILLRSAAAIERAGTATRIVFDKTGTLTTGRLRVTRVETITDLVDRRSILMAAAAIEAMSEHPVARAIVNAAADEGIPLRPVGNFRARPGEGAEGVVDGIPVSVIRDPEARAACIVTVRERTIGRIHVDDTPRTESRHVIARLRQLGIAPTMLTGDRWSEALAVGNALGLADHEITAEASPEDKLAVILAAGPGTIVVGDGINDAAALAEADLGIAVGSGTAVALESADVVLVADSIRGVPAVVGIARATLRTIRQNLFFAFVYNAAAIPAAAFGLLGPHGPLVAAAAMGMSDLCVVGNAIRLRPVVERLAAEAAGAGLDEVDEDEPPTEVHSTGSGDDSSQEGPATDSANEAEAEAPGPR